MIHSPHTTHLDAPARPPPELLPGGEDRWKNPHRTIASFPFRSSHVLISIQRDSKHHLQTSSLKLCTGVHGPAYFQEPTRTTTKGAKILAQQDKNHCLQEHSRNCRCRFERAVQNNIGARVDKKENFPGNSPCRRPDGANTRNLRGDAMEGEMLTRQRLTNGQCRVGCTLGNV